MSRPVSFTFDDGPDEVWTPRVQTELERLGVRATFFVVTERVLRCSELVCATLDAGHEVQLHCHRHVRHTQLTESELRCDTERALEALACVGVAPTLWRAPWGVEHTNKSAPCPLLWPPARRLVDRHARLARG